MSINWTELHQAAFVRAYRTLAQGLGGSATATALTAVISAYALDGESAGKNALIALIATVGASVVAAGTAFFQGVANGLPEAQ